MAEATEPTVARVAAGTHRFDVTGPLKSRRDTAGRGSRHKQPKPDKDFEADVVKDDLAPSLPGAQRGSLLA
jgi:hypothetical protein